jgi:hypothetical protein
MTPTQHDRGYKAASDKNKATKSQSEINNLLTICDDDFAGSESIIMLQADIAALEHRQLSLENEIFEASRHVAFDDSMVADLKSRVLFIREEIDRLRSQANDSYH